MVMTDDVASDDERADEAGAGEDVATSRDDVYFRSPDDGQLIPDLSRLPEERWLEALRPLNRSGRRRAANTSGDPPSTGARRQVNFRLGPGEHARLIEAAKVFGMRPTVLARLLTVRGVDRALREARRDA
jgi:hypothetical protein